MPDQWKSENNESRADGQKSEASARILVVDDEPCILRFFAAIFPAPDYSVAVAANDKTALQLVATQNFDLAIVDYFLEAVNGAEVARKMHKLQPQLKIVLMSGYVLSNKAAEMEAAGASAFLTKPFTCETAHHIVERLLHETEPKPGASMNASGTSPAIHEQPS